MFIHCVLKVISLVVSRPDEHFVEFNLDHFIFTEQTNDVRLLEVNAKSNGRLVNRHDLPGEIVRFTQP